MAWAGSNENYHEIAKGIKIFLQSIGMDQYYETFVAKGFDLETDLPHLTTSDLDELNITVPEHRCVLLAAAPIHRVSDDFRVYLWLRDNGLDYYYVSFVRSELVDFDDIRNLELPDDELYEELEITLTGHKRRLERAVQKLRKRQRTVDEAEAAICEGWWGKPVTLTEAKYDFLCVTATIGSTTHHSRCQTIDFMVDSGSDVTTLREEILETLELELLGPIQSRGVHASCTKNLYKARLQLGSEVLEIEVMGESYNSLGSRVFRHFRHYVTGSKHVWLKGDYYDPSMIPQPLIPHTVSAEMLTDASDPETQEDCEMAPEVATRDKVLSDMMYPNMEEKAEENHEDDQETSKLIAEDEMDKDSEDVGGNVTVLSSVVGLKNGIKKSHSVHNDKMELVTFETEAENDNILSKCSEEEEESKNNKISVTSLGSEVENSSILSLSSVGKSGKMVSKRSISEVEDDEIFSESTSKAKTDNKTTSIPERKVERSRTSDCEETVEIKNKLSFNSSSELRTISSETTNSRSLKTESINKGKPDTGAKSKSHQLEMLPKDKETFTSALCSKKRKSSLIFHDPQMEIAVNSSSSYGSQKETELFISDISSHSSVTSEVQRTEGKAAAVSPSHNNRSLVHQQYLEQDEILDEGEESFFHQESDSDSDSQDTATNTQDIEDLT